MSINLCLSLTSNYYIYILLTSTYTHNKYTTQIISNNNHISVREDKIKRGMCHAMRLRRYILRLLWLRPCIVIINISLTFTFLYFQMIVGDILIIYWFTPYLISFYI